MLNSLTDKLKPAMTVLFSGLVNKNNSKYWEKYTKEVADCQKPGNYVLMVKFSHKICWQNSLTYYHAFVISGAGTWFH